MPPRPLTSGVQGMMQMILERRRQQEMDQMRRQQMEQDRQLQERELAIREQDSQQRQRAQTLNEAMNVLALGDKDAAGALLQSRGIDLRRETPVTSDQMGPGSPTFAHLRTPEEREIATEERRFGREKEMVGLRGAEERATAEHRGRVETETRQATDPQAAIVEFTKRAQQGDPQAQALLDALLVATRKDEGAMQSLTRHVVGKLMRGEPLESFERDFEFTHIRGRKAPDVEAAETAERGRRIEKEGREEGRAEEGLRLRRGEAARAGESLEIRRGESQERGRSAAFDDLDREVNRVRQRIQSKVNKLSEFNPKRRQEAMAALQAEEEAEINKVKQVFKRRFPKFAADIDAGTTEFGAKRPTLMDVFKPRKKAAQ